MLVAQTKSYTGNDCSGSNGSSNRILTLDNTSKTTQSGFLVYASGLALAIDTEYSVDHKSADTTITFLNPMWNDMTIIVNYYQYKSSVTRYDRILLDFQEIIEENGKECTLIRQTETTSSMGDITNVSEENYTIVVLIQDITRDDRQIHEMGLAIPGNSKAFFFNEYLDVMTGNGDVEVKTGDLIKDDESIYWRVEKMLSEHVMEGSNVFKSAIIKKVDLTQ